MGPRWGPYTSIWAPSGAHLLVYGPHLGPLCAHMLDRFCEWCPFSGILALSGAQIGPIWETHLGPLWNPVAHPVWGPDGLPIWGPYGNPHGAHMGPLWNVCWVAPPVLESLLQRKERKYQFRYTNILEIPSVRTTKYGKNSFAYAASVLWNSFPNKYRQETSFSHFKSMISNWNGVECECIACKNT